jgi:hypothetical protein
MSMWGTRKRKRRQDESPAEAPRSPLKDALRQARIETAERTSVVVDLRDAELARLELLNEALDPVFTEIPPEVELFDRGISQGEVPRLWIDVIAFVVMSRDKRIYRFVLDTRFGRKILLESPHVPDIVEAVTRYVAGQLIERERGLAGMNDYFGRNWRGERRRGRGFAAFLLGILVGIAGLAAAAWFSANP